MLFDFSWFIDLPFIWGGIIAFAILMYILLDGFVLGVGILFPLMPKNADRDRIMHSIAPFWDANQTWLVLGGGGLLAAFPLAYSTILSAFYVPMIAMLLGLIFRGAAFEFRFKETNPKIQCVWSYFFHFGSLGAAFFQGCILGGYVQGIAIEGRSFSGTAWDWASAFSILVGIGLVFGYALLGATWTILKTDGPLQKWARNTSLYCSIFVTGFLVFIAIFMPLVQERIFQRWFFEWNVAGFGALCFIMSYCLLGLWYSLGKHSETQPLIFTIAIFITAYIGLGLSLYPWIVPFHFTIYEACAEPTSLSLMLVGIVCVLPVILGYTAYNYFVFRGKTHYENLHY